MTCKGFFFSRKISILDKETPSNGIFRHYFNFKSCSIGWFRYLVPLRSHFGSLSKILPGFAIRQCHLSLPLLFVSGTPDIHCGVHFYDGGNCFWKIRSRSLPLGLQSSKEFHIVWKLLKMPHFIFFNLAFSTHFCPIKSDLPILGIFNELLSTQNVEWDFFWNFQTPWIQQKHCFQWVMARRGMDRSALRRTKPCRVMVHQGWFSLKLVGTPCKILTMK